MDKNALFKLSYGLFILSGKIEEKHNACIINTAMQVSDNPSKICISVNKSNYTHDIVLKTGKFNLSILSEDSDFDLFKHFGFQSGRNIDKFADFDDYKISENGLTYITKGTNSFISADVKQTVDLGSHTLFIAAISEAEILSESASVTYEFYHQNIKPQPKTSADSDGKTVWVCRICGYEYEGETIPDDYICPLCKHPASDFDKVIK